MTTPAMPRVECQQQHPSLAVSDLVAAVDFYTKKLGFFVAFIWGTPPTMAGVNLGHVQMFLEQGTPSPKGCSVYFVIGDAEELVADEATAASLTALYEFQRANGIEVVEPPGDRPWGLRDYTVRDLDGYALTFGYRLSGVTVNPLKIERVNVPVRLEKRLAGLLHDLAIYKRMSVNSCLEEILLHTCEPLGDGIASPHTKRTIDYIQELKKKHGIDYDCHASYRFTED